MSFGEGNLRGRIDHLEEVNGYLCAEINRQERRIRQLESLAFDTRELALRLARLLDAGFPRDVDRPTHYEETYAAIAERMRELGIEVDDE